MNDRQSTFINLIEHPAFLVREGKVCQANPAAHALAVTEGEEVAPMLLCSKEALDALHEGCLCSAITLSGIQHPVEIQCTDEGLLFLLDSGNEDESSLQVLALAAQQLRMPMTNVMQAATQITDYLPTDDADAVRQVRSLKRGLFQILRTITNMSDAYDLIHPMLTKEPTDMGAFCAEIFEKVAALAEPLGIDIAFDLPKRDITLMLDRQQIERCIHNLISNSLRFTPKGGFIHASLKATYNHCILSILDSGEGLHQQIQQTLHARYRRKPTVEDGRYGLGLGLHIARQIILAHGGALFIGPGPQGGTIISISITKLSPEYNTLETPVFSLDYGAHWDHTLLELSRELPDEAFDYL